MSDLNRITSKDRAGMYRLTRNGVSKALASVKPTYAGMQQLLGPNGDAWQEYLEDGIARFTSTASKKFALLVDLGFIIVPDDHVSETYLTRFKKHHQDGKKKTFLAYNNAITDANFGHPTYILSSGDTLRVSVFHQIVSSSTTCEERMDYLRSQKMDTYTGAQGLAMVFDQKRDLLPKGNWLTSLDEKNHLPSLDGYHRVPQVVAHSGVAFYLGVGYLEEVLNEAQNFLGFSKVKKPHAPNP